MIFTKRFWAATTERAIKTTAQAMAAVLTANATGLLDTDWIGVLSAAAMAGVLSILTSIGSAGATDGTPSLASETITEPRRALPDDLPDSSDLPSRGPSYTPDPDKVI